LLVDEKAQERERERRKKNRGMGKKRKKKRVLERERDENWVRPMGRGNLTWQVLEKPKNFLSASGFNLYYRLSIHNNSRFFFLLYLL
jgi:hypothetical protein